MDLNLPTPVTYTFDDLKDEDEFPSPIKKTLVGEIRTQFWDLLTSWLMNLVPLLPRLMHHLPGSCFKCFFVFMISLGCLRISSVIKLACCNSHVKLETRCLCTK